MRYITPSSGKFGTFEPARLPVLAKPKKRDPIYVGMAADELEARELAGFGRGSKIRLAEISLSIDGTTYPAHVVVSE